MSPLFRVVDCNGITVKSTLVIIEGIVVGIAVDAVVDVAVDVAEEVVVDVFVLVDVEVVVDIVVVVVAIDASLSLLVDVFDADCSEPATTDATSELAFFEHEECGIFCHEQASLLNQLKISLK